MNKTAQASFWSTTFPGSLLLLALSSIVNPTMAKVVTSAESKFREKAQTPKNWEKMLERFPELGENYETNKRLFETIDRMFPTIGANPEAAISVMRVAKDYSTGGIDVATLANLAKVEEGIGRGRAATLFTNSMAPGQNLAAIMKEVGNMDMGFGPDIAGQIDRTWRLQT